MARARRSLSLAMHQSGGRIGCASLPWIPVKDSDAHPPSPPPAASGNVSPRRKVESPVPQDLASEGNERILTPLAAGTQRCRARWLPLTEL